VYNVEGVNILNKGAIDEWMPPHPYMYTASWGPWYYKIKLKEYLRSINGLVLVGVMK